MKRIALYMICAAGLAVIGTKLIYSASAQSQHDAQRAEEQWCRDSATHRPEIPAKIEEPAKEDEEKSPIVKALLEVIAEFDGDEDDNTKESRDLLRRVLREADPELARSLGKNSLRLIAEANCKPKRLPLYLHCDKDDQDGKDQGDGSDAQGDTAECPHIAYPLRWGTVENPLTLKDKLELERKWCQEKQKPAAEKKKAASEKATDETLGEDPFGAE
jgi:hypothetical protein